MILQTFHERTARWVGDTWQVNDLPKYYWENGVIRSPEFTQFADALNWIIQYDRRNHE